jgi:hypothetical protein
MEFELEVVVLQMPKLVLIHFLVPFMLDYLPLSRIHFEQLQVEDPLKS